MINAEFFKNQEITDELIEEVALRKVDWANPASKISIYFTVGEATLLREWGRFAHKQDGLTDAVKISIVHFAVNYLDLVRDILGVPLYIKSWWRPAAYNKAIKGATSSAHLIANIKDDLECAVDFWTDADGDGDKDGKDCDEIKMKLLPHLSLLGLRMEDNGKGAKWVHLDNRTVLPGGKRFFKP